MTVRVTIRTHAVAASVVVKTATEGVEGHNVNEETVEVGPRQSHDLHLSGKTTIEVFEHEPTADEAPAAEDTSHLPLDPTNVPGRAENDALLAGDTSANDARRGQKPLKGEPPADASAQ